MGVKTEAIVTWTCDRCKKTVTQKDMPCTANDPWGKLMVDQPSGFDMSGAPWAPRMRDPLLLCGTCIDEIVNTVNRKPYRHLAEGTVLPGLAIRFDGPPSHESGRFVEAEVDGKGANVGEWVQEGAFWCLHLPDWKRT